MQLNAFCTNPTVQLLNKQSTTLGKLSKKKNLFGTLSQTMGRGVQRWVQSPKLVKITIQLFLLQTSRNVLKHVIHKWGGHIWPFHDALRPQRL